jgi:hypothetical protein
LKNQRALTNVYTFGDINLVNCEFAYALNLIQAPAALPSSLRNLERLFQDCWLFNDSRVSNWDTSNITKMRSVFNSASRFNQPLPWNMSNVTDISYMFYNRFATDATYYGITVLRNRTFNQNINSWNTGNVINMTAVFYGSRLFNQPLDNWDTSKVKGMAQMFSYAVAFNQPLPRNGNKWNTVSVTTVPIVGESTSDSDMKSMFNNATAFNQDISNWCVPLIPTKPVGFDTSTTSGWVTAEKPIWGTCP